MRRNAMMLYTSSIGKCVNSTGRAVPRSSKATISWMLYAPGSRSAATSKRRQSRRPKSWRKNLLASVTNTDVSRKALNSS